jgi:hypothetical protein
MGSTLTLLYSDGRKAVRWVLSFEFYSVLEEFWNELLFLFIHSVKKSYFIFLGCSRLYSYSVLLILLEFAKLHYYDCVEVEFAIAISHD